MTSTQEWNAIGLILVLLGTLLLSLEAIRIARVIRAAAAVKTLSEILTNPLGKRTPLPFRWDYALASALFSGSIFYWAPALALFAVTPAAYCVLYVIYRVLSFALAGNTTGVTALFGLLLVMAGTVCQLTATFI